MAIFAPFGGYAIGQGTVDQIVQDLFKTRAASHQHAVFGNLQFDLITYFEGWEAKFAAEYAEHKLMGRKPALQFVGDQLDEITWNLVFHSGYCQPEVEMLKLRRAVAAHAALPLVLSNGDYKGYFVPLDVQATTKQTTKNGTVVWMECKLTLKEYVLPEVLAETTPKAPPVAAQKGKTKPAGTVKKKPTPRPATAATCRNEPRQPWSQN